MKNIALYLPNGENSMLSVSGILTILERAKMFGLSLDYQLVCTEMEGPVFAKGYSVYGLELLKDHLESIHLLLIPSIAGDAGAILSKNLEFNTLLKLYRQNNGQIASFCTGAYLLAETGLLNGKEASSHYIAMPDLKNRYPEVKWQADKIITDNDGIYTSGGTISSFNLLIYILAKLWDKKSAYTIAKFLQIDYPRISQRPFFIFTNQKKHHDKTILDIQNFMENNFQSGINMEDLSRKFAISRRSLNRRFKRATGMHPQKYLQNIIVERAKELLESSRYSIGEIVDLVGYNDENSFRQLFKKGTGMLPSEYKRKYLLL